MARTQLALGLLGCLCAMLCFTGCFRKRTPPETTAAYAELKSSVDPDAPGVACELMRQFGQENRAYKVAAVAAQDIAQIESQAKERYRTARELARQGEFDRVEKMLDDLATFFQQTSSGREAREFLRFEYPVLKYNQLILRREVDAAQEVLQELRKHELSEEEMAIVERMLDGTSVASGALAQSRMAVLLSTCRSIQVALKMYLAEHERYPEALTLESLPSLGLDYAGRRLSAIRDYTTSGMSFSFTAVGTDGTSRALVTQDEIKEGGAVQRIAR
jgi:hypothetical protein